MTRALIVFLFVFNSAWATDYVGRLAADEPQKGGESSLVGEDTSVSPKEPSDGSAPAIPPVAGASEDRSSLPDDPASQPVFDPSQYVHRLKVGAKTGSCVYLGDGLFITCGHIFLDNPEVVIKIDDRQYGGHRKAFLRSDLAYLKMDRIPSDWPACEATLAPLQHDDQVLVFGMQSGRARAGVADTHRKWNNVEHVEIDFPEGEDFIPGDSGGGVFKDGQLIAVISQDIMVDGETGKNHWGGVCAPLSLEAANWPESENIHPHTDLPPEGVEMDRFEALIFSAVWCGPCRVVKETILPQVKAAGLHVTEVDIEGETVDDEHPVSGRALATQYNISAVPTWVLLKDGIEIHREVYGSANSLLKHLK